MSLTVEELVIKAKENINRAELFELFSQIVDSTKNNTKGIWVESVYAFVSKLVLILLIMILLFVISKGEYQIVMFIECIAIYLIVILSIRHSEKKQYFISVESRYYNLFKILRKHTCYWNDFKSFLITEHEMYLYRNPIFYRNIDKLIYVTLVFFVLENTIRPKPIILKIFTLEQSKLALAELLIIPMIYYMFTDSKFRRLDKIKALIKLVSKFEANDESR